MVFAGWLLWTLIWALVNPVRGQTILSVSSLQQCTAVSVGNTQLNCSQTSQKATTVLVRVGYNSLSNQQTQQFKFGISTAPTSAGFVQAGTATECTPTANAPTQCGYTQEATVRLSISKPALVYPLLELPILLPYLYYYRLVDAGCSDDACVNGRNINWKQCQLTGTTVSRSYKNSIGIVPTPEQFIAQFMAQTAPPGAAYTFDGNTFSMNCPRLSLLNNQYMTPDGDIYQAGEAAVVYTFKCKQGKTQFYALFYQLKPMMKAYQIQNPPFLVSQLNVSITTNNQTETLTVNTDEFQTTAVSADGRFMIKVTNAQTTSGISGPDIPGVIVVTGPNVYSPFDGTIEVPDLDMVPPGANPIINPYLAIDQSISQYSLPTPSIIQLVQQAPPTTNPRSFWYYIGPLQTYCLGRYCGQYGVDPNIYSTEGCRLDFTTYTALFSKTPEFLYANITNLKQILTGVPGFGTEFQGCEIVTGCDAVSYFITMNNGTLAQRMAAATSARLNLPFVWNIANPNVWVNNRRMLVSIPIDSALEVALITRDDFLGLVGTVTIGSFDRTTGTGCALDFASNFVGSGLLTARVCSGAEQPSQAAVYSVFAQCPSSSGLRVLLPTQKTTSTLGPGECEVVQFNLQANSFVGSGQRSCQLYLSSPQATINFQSNSSLILDQTSVVCANGTIPNSTIASVNGTIRFGNGSILAGNNGSANRGATATSIGFGSIAAIFAIVVFVLFVIIMFVVACIVRSSRK